jgi:hypothetical protein
MAIAKLVNVGATSTPRRESVRAESKPKASEKVSSSMFSDSMVSSVIDSIRNYNSQIAKLQDITRGLIISFKGLIVMIRQLNKDMTSRFRLVNKELDASRLDFVRNVLTSPVATPTGTTTLGNAIEEKKEETKKEDPKKEDDKSSFLDDLMGLMGIRGAAKGGSTLLRGMGALISNPVVAGFLGASTATVAAIFGSAAIGDYLMKKFGINEKIAEREKSEEYQELRRTQEGLTDSAIERNVAPVREQRAMSITQFLKSKGLGGPDGTPRGSEITKKGDEVTIIKKGHPDEGKTFNFITGQEIGAPQVQGPPAPAAPAAPTGTPEQTTGGGTDKPATPPTQSSAPEGSAPASPPSAAPDGGGTTGAPAAVPQTPSAPPATQSSGSVPKEDTGGAPQGAGATPTGAPTPQAPAAPAEAGPPKSAAARKRETLDALGAPAPATPAPSAPPAPPETPKMESSGTGAPVVVNNNNVQASSSSSGGEGNNVTGQNFALSAVDPFMNEYLQKIAPSYQ